MSNTPSNAIPYVPENTLDPAAGLNLALDVIDSLLQLAVQGIANDPPASPTAGERWIVGATPTGDWSGEAGAIARWRDDGAYWQFFSGRYALNIADGALYTYDGSAWSEIESAQAVYKFAEVVDEATGARTLAAADAGRWLRCTDAAGCTITVPAQSAEAWAADTEIRGRATQGVTTFAEGTGVTISVPPGKTLEAVAGTSWLLKREAEDSWFLSGELADDI